MIIKLLEEYWPWVLAFSFVTLTVIFIFLSRYSRAFKAWVSTAKVRMYAIYDRESCVFKAWIGTGKKGAVDGVRAFISKENREKIIVLLKGYVPWGIIFIFSTLIIIVMFFDGPSCAFQVWLGTDKKGVIEYLGVAIGGGTVLYGLFKLEQRALAQKNSNDLVTKGHEQDRFKAAIEHLGSSQENLCIASFYEFYHLVRDNNSYREIVFDMLFSYWRQISSKNESNENIPNEKKKSLLDVLFKKNNRVYDEKLDVSLQEACFSKMDMKDIDLQKANLREMDAQDAILENAKFQGANMRGADLRRADMRGADLRRADMRGADFQEINTLNGAEFQGMHAQKMNFQEAFLDRAKFQKAHLARAIFEHASLHGAKFNNAYLQRANFSNVDMASANFQNADLSGANLSNTDVENVDFQNADLRGADMEGMLNYEIANFEGAKYNKKTIPPKESVDLSNLRMIKKP